MSTKQISKSVKASPVVGGEVVGGEAIVIGPDDVVFAVPSKAADRQRVGAENVGVIRDLVSEGARVQGGLLVRLILALHLNPSSGDVDGIKALTTGDGAIEVPESMRKSWDSAASKARAAFPVLKAYGIGSTADPRFGTVAALVGKVGRGSKAIEAAMSTRGGKAALRKAIESGTAAAESGDTATRDNLLKSAVPSSRNSDGPVEGSKAWRSFEAAFKVLDEAANVLPDNDGMTADEREQAHALVTRLADRLSRPAKVSTDDTAGA